MVEKAEIWKPIEGYEGLYWVSNFGRVRNKKRLLKPTLNKARGNYFYVGLCKEGLRKNYYIHSLVLTNFRNGCPKGYECAHLDGNSMNNKLWNLAWATRLENNRHKELHGTDGKGERHSGAKLTEKEVLTIRQAASSKTKSNKELSIEYGVARSTIGMITSGKNWKHSFIK